MFWPAGAIMFRRGGAQAEGEPAGMTKPMSRVDEYVRTAMSDHHIPGLALAVIQNGKAVRIKAYGLANIELDAPVTSRTVFKLCSVSKQFIAAGIMLLVE